MSRSIAKGRGTWVLAAVIPFLLLGAARPGGEYKVIFDGKEVETKVPALARGRFVLIPVELVTRLGVSIKWTKKKMILVRGEKLIEIRNDGGKRGGDVVDGVPRVPDKILRDTFNLWIRSNRVSEQVEIKSKEKDNPLFEEPARPEKIEHGALIPSITLPDLTGKPVALSTFRGKRVAFVVFASWDNSRYHLEGWQEFMDKEAGEIMQVVGVAMEAIGPQYAKQYVKRAHVKFPILLDEGSLIARKFGFTNVPIVIVIDEIGVYARLIPVHKSAKEAIKGLKTFLKQEFRPEYIAAVDAVPVPTTRELKKRVIEGLAAKKTDIPLRLQMAAIFRAEGKLKKAILQMESAHRADRKSGEVLFRWGLYLWLQESKEAAVAKWKEAILLEDRNWTFRKQIWSIRYPKMFYNGKINLTWQQTQIQLGE
ncbi:MAG: TlpA disulfide reductase family protein [Planctomycetota bacterium]|nr:TlpA disulfide reductase family protein [Planctomycetota bacterium]